MKHFIRKEVIALSVKKGIDTFSLQQQMSKVNDSSIIPLLERVFDELSDEEELITVDRLEINLGKIHRDALGKEELGKEIVNRIAEQVREQLKSLHYSPALQKQPIVNGRARVWIQFLKTGRLGWNITVMDTVFRRQVLESLSGDYMMVRQLREIINSYPDVAKRIVYQHDEDFIIRLIGIITATLQDDLLVYGKETARFFRWMKTQGHRWYSSIDDAGDPEVYFFTRALRMAAKGESGPAPAAITTEVLRPELLRFDERKKIPEQMLAEFPLLQPVVEEVLEDAGRTPPEEMTETEMQMQEDEGIENEGVFVELAGLVLLHPFLQQFFKRLGLINAEGFISDKTRLKALYLLYFLGTGEMEAPEEKLVMPKLLCDFPVGRPVKRKFKLTRKEVDECTGLLLALIERWSIIGQTSIEGLRESFLQRNGKIFQRNENIYIQVEARPFDMLLDHLPWNLGIIKLPWKEELIRVEWR
jgi:hypothetical protein